MTVVDRDKVVVPYDPDKNLWALALVTDSTNLELDDRLQLVVPPPREATSPVQSRKGLERRRARAHVAVAHAECDQLAVSAVHNQTLALGDAKAQSSAAATEAGKEEADAKRKSTCGRSSGTRNREFGVEKARAAAGLRVSGAGKAATSRPHERL